MIVWNPHPETAKIAVAAAAFVVLSTLRNREGGSEQIHEGASNSQKLPTDHVERFLSILRFDSKGK
jgi:hypothetical protein